MFSRYVWISKESRLSKRSYNRCGSYLSIPSTVQIGLSECRLISRLSCVSKESMIEVGFQRRWFWDWRSSCISFWWLRAKLCMKKEYVSLESSKPIKLNYQDILRDICSWNVLGRDWECFAFTGHVSVIRDLSSLNGCLVQKKEQKLVPMRLL